MPVFTFALENAIDSCTVVLWVVYFINLLSHNEFQGQCLGALFLNQLTFSVQNRREKGA